jgi:mono/diheme cytochrome c family protein
MATFILIALVFLTGCRQDMHDQPYYRPLSSSRFFADGRSARPLIQGTVARGQLRTDSKLYFGRSGNTPVDTIPIEITEQVLRRGRERFDIFCSPCHGVLGDGEGMVVQRGFRQPPSYHIDRLRQAPPGHFFDVVTNGFGAMPAYGYRVPAQDRWAIIAYIRALQLSQSATPADVPEDKRGELQ